MNLEEASCCWFEKEYEPGSMQDIGTLEKEELMKFAKHCFSLGISALYITLDEEGCLTYFKENDTLQECLVERINVENVADTTGAGDSFTGGLAFGYLLTEDYLQACFYGNAMHAQRCSGTELAIYKSLEETEQQIAETYKV